MAQYAIARVAKLKTTNAIKAVSNHNHRHGKTENANENEANKILLGSTNALNDWQQRIDADGIQIRNKNTVRALEVLLTVSPSIGKAMLKNEKALNTWIDDEMRFLKKEYGSKNVVNAILHLDETTPHIHAVVVPEFENKLNAKHFTGGKKAMADFQTRHFENFSPMLKKPLSRGKKFSKAKHESMAELYNKKNGPVNFQQLTEKAIFFETENATLRSENETLKTRNKELLSKNIELADRERMAADPTLKSAEQIESARIKEMAEKANAEAVKKLSRMEKAKARATPVSQIQGSRMAAPKPAAPSFSR